MEGTAVVLSLGYANPKENPPTNRHHPSADLGIYARDYFYWDWLPLFYSFHTGEGYCDYSNELATIGVVHVDWFVFLGVDHMVYFPTNCL